MKIQIFADRNKYKLEREVNDMLRKYKNEDILDIKYTGSGNSACHSVEEYSVMIIFK